MARDRTTAARVGTAAIFTTTGILHFTHEKFFIAIVPKSLPSPKALVQISGVAELAGAAGVLIPRTRKLAGKGLIALLIAVFPANINMALNPDRFKQFPAWALWARLPLQFAAIALVWRGSQRRTE
ncbi:MAG: DoxX family protein [Thermoleophilaceae bacterium]|nr:DoxX family protein [Thermoleophilaceae bacterium]